MAKEFIGIDLGSNSLRAVRMAYDCKNNAFSTLGEFETTVRTAERLEESGEICDEAILRITEGLLQMRQSLNITNSDTIIALTTQAMRKARNQKEVLEILHSHTGIMFKVISGITEARITSLAPKMAINRLKARNPKYDKNCFLLIDMGGASSEFIVCMDYLEFARSFEIGIVSAKERYKSVENLLARKLEFLAPIKEFLQDCKDKGAIVQFIVANSGTPTMVCAMKLGLVEYDSKKVFGEELSLQDFENEAHKFAALSKEEQIASVGLYKADVVPFGIALFTSFMECLGIEECLVIDEGLREGAVIGRVLGIV